MTTATAETAATRIAIKHRWTGTTLYECDVPAEYSGMAMRHALESAVRDGARLDGARLVGARLDGASLVGASLVGARLDGARLDGASLDERQLSIWRDDIWAVLSSAPHEAQAVLDALRAGRVDGSTYSGECACLVGTIAKARHCDFHALGVLQPDSRRPAEQWFMQVRPGQTPQNHKPAAQAAQWVAEWIDAMRGAFGAKPAA